MIGKSIEFATQIFGHAWSRVASERVLDVLLDALVEIDCIWLRVAPTTPHLYQSGVRYHHDASKEKWLSIPEAMHEGVADCKSLSAWLVAYYRTSGIDREARCVKRLHDLGDLLLYHIVVQRADGTIEDPSRQLGMNAPEPDGYRPMPGVPWKIANGMTSMVGAAMLGNAEALAQLEALRARGEAGDRRAAYLVDVARMIRESGYDPQKTRWAELPDGRWDWTYPTDSVGREEEGR